MQKIDRAEFERMLMDPDVPDSDIRPYLRLDALESQGFQPVVVPNSDRVHFVGTEAAVALASMNGISRWRRQQRYARKIKGWTGLKVVAEGDSWFQYPFLIDDVIDHLFDRWAIYCVSAAGDLLRDIAKQDEIVAAVLSEKPDLLLLSAGGNDVLGGGALQRYLKPYSPDLKAEDYIISGFDDLLARSLDLYAEIIGKALKAGAGKVILHSYDYAIPKNGLWLGRPMEKIGIKDRALQREIVRILINRFHAGLITMASGFGTQAVVVNTRGSVPDDEWYDELHPTSHGFSFPARMIRNAAEGDATEGLEGGVAELPAVERALPVADIAALEALLAADEDILIAELGRREAILSISPEAAGTMSLDLASPGTEGIFGSFRELGVKLVTRMQNELYDLLCGAATSVEREREKLKQSLGLTEAAIIGALTTALMAIACPPFLAPLVAAVIVKKGIQPTMEETCKFWGAKLGKT